MSFDTLGLAAPLLKAIADAGYTTPTPIQAQAIPAVLNGGDLMAGAQTGTGKTAGFTLPMLHRLSTGEKLLNKRGKIAIRALVLTPTRELAAQVEESVQTYGKYLPLKSMVMFGGVGMQPQINKLRDGVDILVATPGRLLDHAQQGTLDLSQVQILVLDEADRMLDMGFVHDIKKVLALLPAQKQSLLFSATFSDEIKNLADRLLNQPALIEVARRNQTNDQIAQKVHPVGRERKKELLVHLIKSGDWHQVLVFTRMKHGANRLTDYLNDQGISAMAIHGNKSQGARTKALADFKSGDLTCLVATDIAARGIDIDQLPHVVNFELPNVPEDYVHRIGRTGRAGAQGEAVSLVCVDENGFLRDIERLIKREIPKEIVPGFAPDPNEKAEPIVLGRTVLNPNGSRGRNPNPPAHAGRGGRPGGNGGGGRGGDNRGGSRDGGRPGGKPQAHAGHGGAKPAGAHAGHGGAKPAGAHAGHGGAKPHAQHAPRNASAQPSRDGGSAPRHNNGPRLTQPKR
ncbi:DEAD/DEAH box helicase [Roseateles saccharophilus]|uniref:ATP-dependent RNA helicase RhlE n=1 Tax=Roseateles saccharophilus TaxID=304 RepID=A0A4R3VJ08_ROSSA|nr:DEAD/DEAH box helicase [Roseateles saccharophilus]MDG0832835.1 DEAD/DEAH box helicase [Roseateles saccharophilus]TCV03804.1 ATP-dependent RNA helicase RhlE [Roseateles saccharophilus]